MGLFDSLVDFTESVVKVVAAPVDVVVTIAASAAKPVAETVEELAKDIKEK